MLSVVLTILKFIGITILVLLGLLLLVVGLVLFVPVRYKAEGFYKDSYRVQAKISWLLHIVSFSLLYEKEQPFQMKLRILGIPIYNNLQKKEKKKKRRKKTVEEETVYLEEEKTPEIVASSIPEKKEIPDSDAPELKETESGEIDSSDKTKAISLLQKIKKLFTNVISFFRNIKYTFYRICATIKGIKDNITYYAKLLQKDSTKAALAACKKQLLRIFKNLKPQKFQVNLHIGMEDPATMGDILGVWGMLYPIHEGHVDICPDFDQAVFEGDFYCKGRVTIYVYIWTLMIILFDKNIRRLRKSLVREGN